MRRTYDWELCKADLEPIEFERAQHITRNWSTVELPHSIFIGEEHIVLCEALSWKPHPGKAISKTPCGNSRWVVGGEDCISEVDMKVEE